ncbi:MAG: Gldg family protein, partial [Rhodobiaceae bacterium]|nr:Gldg family protein [Rhodobiaceae bacterium]
VAGDKLILEVIDPAPFSDAEERAMSLGLKGAPTQDGEIIYFGLAGSNLVDGTETIAFFSDEREEYLEYDLTRMVQNLSRPEKPVLGIVTNLPMDTGAGGMQLAMRGQSQSFMVYQELLNRFQLEFLEQDFAEVPGRVSTMLIAHPKPLNDKTLYAIDQFVMRGGRVLAFIDPHSEVSLTSGPSGKPVQGFTEASDLSRLMDSWGVVMAPNKIVGDRLNAQRVQAGFDARRQEVAYPIWLALRSDRMDVNDIVTADIDRLNLGTVGHLKPIEGATTTFQPLVRSSQESMLYELDYVKSGPRPDDLMRTFKASEESYVIAARLTGTVSSAFEGPPASDDAEAQRVQTVESHLSVSETPANIIVFADSEIFDDRFWVRIDSYLGERVAQPIADNAKFILNAVENMMGSDALISLRTRERAERPFLVVEAMRAQAEALFLAEEEALQVKISAAEKRLASLQSRTQGTGAQSVAQSAASSSQQAVERARIREELTASRKELRSVQRKLREGIESLGESARFYNVILMPIFIGIAALLYGFYRRRRRALYMASLKTQSLKNGSGA